MDWNAPHRQRQRLLVTSQPKPDESFTGFVLRLTELNFYRRPTWILKLAGANHIWVNRCCSFSFVNADWSQMSGVTGIRAEMLASLPYPPGEATNTSVVYGHTIPQYLIRVFKPKVCPACLRETGYCRKTWDLAFVTACPRHKCLLLDVCPGCQKAMTLVRSKVSVCRCEYDWREAEAPPVEDSELRLVRHVRRLFGLPEEGRKKGVGIGQPLEGLSLEALLLSTFFILGQQRGVLDTRGKQSATFRLNADLHRSLMDALAVFEDWPESFYRFLDWRRQQKIKDRFSGASATGVHKEFGTFHEGLHRALASADYAYLRQAYKDYLSTRWDGGIMRAGLVRETSVDRSKYVSRIQAGKFLGVDYNWIVKLIEAGRLNGVVRHRKRQRLILVERESMIALKGTLEDSIGLQKVARRLRVDGKTVGRLVEYGYLEPNRTLEIEGYVKRWFPNAGVDELLQRVRSKVDPMSLTAGDVPVKWDRAITILQNCRLGAAELVRAILDDRVVPCQEGAGVGLRRFRFARQSLQGYLQTRVQGEQVLICITEASEQMGLNRPGAYFLAKTGFIPTEDVANKRRHEMLVTKETIDSFKAAYTSVAELARRHDVYFQTLLRLLVANGIEPVSGRSVDGGRLYIVRNADLRGVDVQRLVNTVRQGRRPKARRNKTREGRHGGAQAVSG